MSADEFMNIFENQTFDCAQNPIVEIESTEIVSCANFLKEKLNYEMLLCISAVDFKDKFELLYNFYSLENKKFLIVKIKLSHNDPKVESLSAIYKSANWYERECFDLMGIDFLNHPNLERILMPKDWRGYPLRKDYEQNDERLIWNERR